MDRRARGTAAESVAREYLCARGLTFVCGNYRCRQGELDLVFVEDGVLVVVEVRLRSNARYGGALESVDTWKRRRIVLATEHLRRSHGQLASMPVRFDVVAFQDAVACTSGVEWIRGAFAC